MNCDDAFDALTDPLHRDGDELRWHLDLCPRCRQMREILAPALDVLTPCEGGPAWSDGLSDAPADAPRSAPLLTPEAVRLAERVASELASAPMTTGRRDRRRAASALWWAAGCALALCLGLFAFQPGTQPAPIDGDCPWRAGRDHAGEAAGSPRTVVLSCVACHLHDRASVTPPPRTDGEAAAMPLAWSL